MGCCIGYLFHLGTAILVALVLIGISPPEAKETIIFLDVIAYGFTYVIFFSGMGNNRENDKE